MDETCFEMLGSANGGWLDDVIFTDELLLLAVFVDQFVVVGEKQR